MDITVPTVPPQPVTSPRPRPATVRHAYLRDIATHHLSKARVAFCVSSPQGLRLIQKAYIVHHYVTSQREQCCEHDRAVEKMGIYPQETHSLIAQKDDVSTESVTRCNHYQSDFMSYYAAYRAAFMPPLPPIAPQISDFYVNQPRGQMDSAALRGLEKMLVKVTPLARSEAYYNDLNVIEVLKNRRFRKCPKYLVDIPTRPLPPWGSSIRFVRPVPVVDLDYKVFAADCICSRTGHVVYGRLDGPSNIGQQNPLRKNMYQFDCGISKTFAVIEFPHAYASASPLEFVSARGGGESLRLGELERCLAYSGHHATTAHTFLQLNYELILFFASMGGFTTHITAALSEGAVDAAYLVDFSSGNKYNGYMSPLFHRVNIGRGCFDNFETLIYSGDDEDQRSEDLAKQSQQMHELSPIPGLAKTLPQHNPNVNRWTSVTPNDLFLPGHDPRCKDLRIDIQVKSFSGADQPLIQEAGISLDIFKAVKLILLENLAAENSSLGDDERLVCKFISQSTIFAVRAVASICIDGFRYRQFTLACGGWVAPPRHARYERMHRQQVQQASDLTHSPPAEPTDTNRVSAYKAHFRSSMIKLRSAAKPPTLPDEHELVRFSPFLRQLYACKKSVSNYTSPTLVHPRDVRGAKDLPKAYTRIYLRDNPECETTRHLNTPPYGTDEPEPPVWQELSDPTLEDVLWLTHKLMTSNGMRYFPRIRADFGINWDMEANRRYGQQEEWAATNIFVSPAPMTEAHSQMLYRAYESTILDVNDLQQPAAPRPPPSSLLKPSVSLKKAPCNPIAEASWDGHNEVQMLTVQTQAMHVLHLYRQAERLPE
ncbi:hypothetical protein F503_03843 [Ophiostoma piceae UAMH 11346]|uniref:Uncharacterized protein n=1 Tax=Ophiostoma piceae (strain UAMH 11346) TaxID=1262450 RepID=S3CG50_OPHP1|nr:hypothetical protein F503_03843 [Ophiostoma piceae UAMH 11346]